MGDRNAGFEALGPVGSARDDRLGRDEQARAGDDALIDRLLEADVGEARAFGAEVALGGEAGFEGAFGLDHGAGGAKGERLMQDLIVPEGFVVGMEEEMGMALDHARHQRRTGQVDGLGTGRSGEVGPNRRNAIAVDEHAPTFVGLRINAVEDTRGAEQEAFRGCRRGQEQAKDQRRESNEIDEVDAHMRGAGGVIGSAQCRERDKVGHCRCGPQIRANRKELLCWAGAPRAFTIENFGEDRAKGASVERPLGALHQTGAEMRRQSIQGRIFLSTFRGGQDKGMRIGSIEASDAISELSHCDLDLRVVL